MRDTALAGDGFLLLLLDFHPLWMPRPLGLPLFTLAIKFRVQVVTLLARRLVHFHQDTPSSPAARHPEPMVGPLLRDG